MVINWHSTPNVLLSIIIHFALFPHHYSTPASETSTAVPPSPNLDGTSKEPIFALVDEDVFIDCKVDNISN